MSTIKTIRRYLPYCNNNSNNEYFMSFIIFLEILSDNFMFFGIIVFDDINSIYLKLFQGFILLLVTISLLRAVCDKHFFKLHC